MSCICVEKLKGLTSTLQSMQPASLMLPSPLAALAPLMSGLSICARPGVASQAQMLQGAKLPPVPLSPMQLARLDGLGQSVGAVQRGTGVHLAQPGALGQITPMLSSLKVNGSALAPLAKLNPTPWMALAQVAALLSQLKSAFGLNLLTGNPAKQSAQLSTALGQLAKVPPLPAPPASAAGHATMLGCASNMKIDLLAPKGTVNLASSARISAGLKIPAVHASPMALGNALAMLAALLGIRQGLGIDPLSPDFGKKTAAMQGALAPYGAVQIPPGLAGKAAAGSQIGMVSPLLTSNLPKLGKANLTPLASIPAPAPSMSSLGSLGSVMDQAKMGTGSSLLQTSACGGVCPVL